MIKYVNYDIVFQEYPDETTLAINLSLCPNHCPGCHSAFLAEDLGDELTESRLFALLDSYEDEITCVGFQGGDNDPAALVHLARRVKQRYEGKVRVGWYSGREDLPECFDPAAFDYVKLGPWKEACGPLKETSTNQRLYRYSADGSREDITARFWKKGSPQTP